MILPRPPKLVSLITTLLLVARPGRATITESSFASGDIIITDVAIIGGGSSGTYAAIRLRELGHSVAVVEQKDTLGGHVNTFFDPATGASFDYGVIVFANISVVTDYFAHFNLPLGPGTGSTGGTTQYFNFRDDSGVSPTVFTGNSTEALIGYLEQLNKYPYLFPNGYQIPLPVPEDLLIPFGDFLEKYNLQALSYIAFEYIQGVGNILKQPTVYVMKYFAPLTVTSILDGIPGEISTLNHDNHALYVAAANELGADAFLSTNVTQVERCDDIVYTIIETPNGPKLLKSSYLLIAIQPKLPSLQPFLDLDPYETSIFGQFNNSYYWDGVVNNTGIPSNVSFGNVDPSAALDLPAMPALYGVENELIDDYHAIYYSSPYHIPDEEVISQTLATINALVEVAGYPGGGNAQMVQFNSHAPFELTVSVEAIKDGFYTKLYGLEGRRRTFWTGATWQAHDSSQIWNWTEFYLLPKIQAALVG